MVVIAGPQIRFAGEAEARSIKRHYHGHLIVTLLFKPESSLQSGRAKCAALVCPRDRSENSAVTRNGRVCGAFNSSIHEEHRERGQTCEPNTSCWLL